MTATQETEAAAPPVAANEDHIEPDATKPPKKGRRDSAYDRQTPEKVAAGKRMVEARELAGFNQEQAARRLGYNQQVDLSRIESGYRPAPLHVLIAAARLYGTTMDFLCGLADDSDRDPGVAAARTVGDRVSFALEGLTKVMVRANMDMVRDLLPSTVAGERLAALTVEVNAALALVVARNPKFEDMRGGATLLAKVGLASKAAAEYGATVARARRLMKVRVGAQQDLFALYPVLDLAPASAEAGALVCAAPPTD
jgi:transcriptional regulator with XRE-family HTH domain